MISPYPFLAVLALLVALASLLIPDVRTAIIVALGAFIVAVPILVLSWLSLRKTERERQAELEAKEADWQRYRNAVLERKEQPAKPERMYERRPLRELK